MRRRRRPLGLGPESGALVTFTGLCRDEGGTLAALEIECYPEMAEAEIARVAAETETRWPLDALLVVHRYGLIRAGGSDRPRRNRQRASRRCLRGGGIPDGLPQDPRAVLEKQHGLDGRAGDWIAPREEDDAAAAKWISSRPPAP